MCAAGIAHDPLQRDIFTPLYFGASLYIPTQEDVVQPGQLAKWMHRHKITVSCFTPAMGQLLTTVANPGFVRYRDREIIGQLPEVFPCAAGIGGWTTPKCAQNRS